MSFVAKHNSNILKLKILLNNITIINKTGKNFIINKLGNGLRRDFNKQ